MKPTKPVARTTPNPDDLVRDEAISMARELESRFRMLADEIAARPKYEGAFANEGEWLAQVYERVLGGQCSERYRLFFAPEGLPAAQMPRRGRSARWMIPVHHIELQAELSLQTFPEGHRNEGRTDLDHARIVLHRLRHPNVDTDTYAISEVAKAIAAWRADYGKWEAVQSALTSLGLVSLPTPDNLAREYRKYREQISDAMTPQKPRE